MTLKSAVEEEKCQIRRQMEQNIDRRKTGTVKRLIKIVERKKERKKKER